MGLQLRCDDAPAGAGRVHLDHGHVGLAGYDTGDFTKTFNGTSSATPAVAGAAALMLSANPALSASSVRDLLAKTATKLEKQTTWTPELGWGRLDVAKAVAAAKIAGTTKPPKVPKAPKAAKRPVASKAKARKSAKATAAKRRTSR